MNRFKNIKFDRKLVIKLILLSPVIALLVYVVFVRPVQVRLEQREFKKAEAFLEEKKNEINALAGPADSVKKENSCGYSSAKFSKGSLGCGSSFEFIFVTSELDKVNKIIRNVSVLGDSTLNLLGDNVNGFTKDTAERGGVIGQDIDYKNFSCSLDYRYEIIRVEEPYLSIYLGCSRQAMTEIYPVTKD